MSIYLVLHKIPQGANQPSLFDEVVMAFTQKDRTPQKMQLLKANLSQKGIVSIVENKKWGVFLVASDLSAEEIFVDIKSALISDSNIEDIELLVFGISEWGGIADESTVKALQEVIGSIEIDASDSTKKSNKNDIKEQPVECIIQKKIHFSIVRCRHCKNPAMYGSDVCYTCNSK